MGYGPKSIGGISHVVTGRVRLQVTRPRTFNFIDFETRREHHHGLEYMGMERGTSAMVQIYSRASTRLSGTTQSPRRRVRVKEGSQLMEGESRAGGHNRFGHFLQFIAFCLNRLILPVSCFGRHIRRSLNWWLSQGLI